MVIFACIYIFIPSPIRISKEVKIKGFDQNIFTLLSDSNYWKKSPKDSIHSEYSFQVKRTIYPRVFIEAENLKRKLLIEIEILNNAKIDSSNIYWHCEFNSGKTPWGRLQAYMNAKKLKEIFSEKIKVFSEYVGKTENIYGISITESKVKDTLVATFTKWELNPPSDSLICLMINTLKDKISKSNLLITDSIMLLIPHHTAGKYKVMVGFPLNKEPDIKSDISSKKMIPGKLLTGIVTGGYWKINYGFLQIKKYISDRGIEEVALPYEVFVTNRCIEKDTLKWITKICYPVF
jgi:effector-binding domain-containing protein